MKKSKMAVNIEKAKNLAIDGLFIDGSHHKQWYLEQILIALGYELTDIASELNRDDWEEWYEWVAWDEGIAP